APGGARRRPLHDADADRRRRRRGDRGAGDAGAAAQPAQPGRHPRVPGGPRRGHPDGRRLRHRVPRRAARARRALCDSPRTRRAARAPPLRLSRPLVRVGHGPGGSADVRDLLAREAADAHARLALEVFCHRARKYLGAYLAVLEGADAVVFTGGVGEHQPEIRRRIAAGFEWCGLTLDAARNAAARGTEAVISAAGSTMVALVVAADEERMIAADTVACLGGVRARPPGR